MTPIRKLAGQTAIYGVSSIIGRVMNFLLTPLYTRVFLDSEYGVVTELYAYVAFLIVLLTYGMETALFRFSSREETASTKNKVFGTALVSILSTSTLFIVLIYLMIDRIAPSMGYGSTPEYILFFTWIVALDAIVTIPLAKLRLLNKPYPFVIVNLLGIFLNIALNLFFILYCPMAMEDPQSFGHEFITSFYKPEFGIGYIFIANLASSVLKFLLLIPWMFDSRPQFDRVVWKQLLRYGGPLLFLGLAGIVNETFDRAFFTDISGLPAEEAKAQLGIYGACYKVAMLLSIGIQAYRFAAEPFIFSLAVGKKREETQAVIMKYYFLVSCFIALAILFFLDEALILIGEEFRSGADVIPILLFAYVLFGAVFNLSFWYKLNDKTFYGAGIAFSGAFITIVLNLILIPRFSFYGCAIATLAAYAVMALLSFLLGQKHAPISYPLRRIGTYLGLALFAYFTLKFVEPSGLYRYLMAFLFLGFYLGLAIKLEKIKLRIPFQ